MRRTTVLTAVFFFAAPGLVAGLVPWLVTDWSRPDEPVGAVDLLGWALVLAGLAMVVECFARFVREGSGTPAPVAPTEFLVQGGLYRYLRNPMYVGVAGVITGEAVIFRSTDLVWWLLAFLALVIGFTKGYEEPTLRRQFGTSYERYLAAVPGWWPRLRPWHG